MTKSVLAGIGLCASGRSTFGHLIDASTGEAAFALSLAILLGACQASAPSRDHTPPTAVIAAYPTSGSAPLHVRFDGTGSSDDVGVVEQRWEFGDGATASGPIADHLFTSRGLYVAALTVRDAAGNSGRAEQAINVTAADDSIAPNALLVASPLSGTAPLAVHLDASGSSDDRAVTSFAWDLGDGASSSAATLDHVYASAGSFLVTLTVRDAAGNAGTAQATITARAPAVDTGPPVAILAASPLAGLAPLQLHLDASGSHDDIGVTRFQFDLGDGRQLAGPVQDVTYPVAGRYALTLTVWDAAGNSASDAVEVSVESLPVVPDERIYSDELDAPWLDWSWATSYSLTAASPIHAGARSIRLTPKGSEGLHFHHPTGFDTSGYDRLSLWIHGGGVGGQKLLLAARYSGVLGGSIALEPYLQSGATAIPASSWVQALVPLAALGASGTTLEGIIIQGATAGTQADIFLDDLTIYPELGLALAPCPSQPPPQGFVSRSGSSLQLGSAAWRGAGANLGYLRYDFAYAQLFGNANLLQHAREALDVLVCLGMPVVRTWAFDERPVATDASSIQPTPGAYREEGLVALDQTVAEAKARGLRLILSLTDNWNYYGGIPQYATWAGKAHDDFFTDAQMKSWWKSYAAMLLSRVNTITGIRYADEPAILAWELGNEFRCAACQGSTRLHDSIAELAAYLKSLGPSQLIADGGEGFDDHPALWSLSQSAQVTGSEGASFSTLAQIAPLDLLSYHVYPVGWGLTAPDTLEWFGKHQQLASQGGKVAYAGEYGWAGTDTARAQTLDTWSTELFQTRSGSLGLLWQILPEGVANNDGFGVYYPADIATLSVLAKWAGEVR